MSKTPGKPHIMNELLLSSLMGMIVLAQGNEMKRVAVYAGLFLFMVVIMLFLGL